MPSCPLGKRPADDRGYLEAMAKVIFSIGLSRSVVLNKWDGFREVFSDFAPEKVARCTARDVDRMTKDDRIIRNHGKIAAIVQNAKTVVQIGKEFGSFREYLRTASREGEAPLCKALSKRFSYLGSRTVVFFLRSVGEELPETMKQWDFQYR